MRLSIDEYKKRKTTDGVEGVLGINGDETPPGDSAPVQSQPAESSLLLNKTQASFIPKLSEASKIYTDYIYRFVYIFTTNESFSIFQIPIVIFVC